MKEYISLWAINAPEKYIFKNNLTEKLRENFKFFDANAKEGKPFF